MIDLNVKMQVPFVDLRTQYHSLKKEIDNAIFSVIEESEFIKGKYVSAFEKEFAAAYGVKHCIGVANGTDAIYILLKMLGIGEGDEVITTSNTFFATAEAIWLVGATPVFVDCEADTRNIDVTKIEEKITPKTKAIIPVHLYGQPANMPVVWDIAKKHNLFVIEDCAQAFGARGDTFKLGEKSDALCTSFITAKNLGTFGDGGAVFVNRDELVEPILRGRNHGSIARSKHSVGWNSRLDDIHAAILSVKLKHIDEFNDARIKWAKLYDKELAGTKINLPYAKPGYRHVYHLYVIETPGRDDLQKFLEDNGIIALTNYPIAIHEQEGFPFSNSQGLAYKVPGITSEGDPKPYLPETEKNSANCLTLPIYPELTEDEVKYVASKVLEWEKGPGAKYFA